MSHSHTWVSLLGLLVTAGTTQAQQAAAFSSATRFTTFSQPVDITVADVNSDGRPDLLTCNFNSNSVGVLLGTGTGSFGAATTYSTGANSFPVGIAVADVTGDGWPDLLTASNTYGWVGVLPGTGMGSFGPMLTYSTGGNGPTSLLVADVNGDNRLDVLVVNSNSMTIGVLLATGMGSLSVAATYSTDSGFPATGAVADVNGDGRPDVVVAKPNSDTASVLLGTGTGSFAPPITFSTGNSSEPRGIAVADVNGDGWPDLLTTNRLNSTVGVLPGTGTGSFGLATFYSTGSGSQPVGIAVVDVNGDNKPDVLTANSGSNTVGVLLGTGATGLGAVSAFATGTTGTIGMAAADVNGDLRPDLLTANSYSGTVGVLLNAGTYTPLAATAGLAAAAATPYPNPAHGRVQVAVPAVAGAATVQATLLDALGRVVRQQSAALPATGTTFALDAAGLAPGVYSLRLQAGAAAVARRVVLR